MYTYEFNNGTMMGIINKNKTGARLVIMDTCSIKEINEVKKQIQDNTGLNIDRIKEIYVDSKEAYEKEIGISKSFYFKKRFETLINGVRKHRNRLLNTLTQDFEASYDYNLTLLQISILNRFLIDLKSEDENKLKFMVEDNSVLSSCLTDGTIFELLYFKNIDIDDIIVEPYSIIDRIDINYNSTINQLFLLSGDKNNLENAIKKIKKGDNV